MGTEGGDVLSRGVKKKRASRENRSESLEKKRKRCVSGGVGYHDVETMARR